MLSRKFHDSYLDQTNLLVGLRLILERTLPGNICLGPEQLEQVGLALLEGLRNYTNTNQGDVGSHVRRAAMEAFVPFVKTGSCAWLIPQIIGGLLMQSVEKIDRIRLCAGTTLQEIVHLDIFIPEKEKLSILLGDQIHWQSPASVFPQMVPLLYIDSYRAPLLAGLVSSAGGMSESLIRHAGGSLIDFLIAATEEIKYEVSKELLVLFKDNHHVDRITLPLLEVLRQMFEAELFHGLQYDELLPQFALAILQEHQSIKDVRKLTACSKVLCALAPVPAPETQRLVWGQVLRFLTHGSPKVRIVTSEHLYLAISASPIDDSEEIEDLLLNTDWSEPLAVLRPLVFALYPRFGLSPPKLIKPNPIKS
ncbi:hypothetical protein DSO57_1009064 [Entomophthora muscae]|uniref:Uncharacterized protein n=1 Tax=Entomophthora muscae TaxID=34485 RepID=A0ACC2RLZ8_9FUNG|nr:hypothetical protein DSO57_1009064 [Entomophthora muscae]